MHDILEGVLPYGIKQLLKHLIETKVWTLSDINNSISSFSYSHSDATNKPNIIESKTLRSNDHSSLKVYFVHNNYILTIFCFQQVKCGVWLGCYI